MISSTTKTNARVFAQLLRRDAHNIGARLTTKLIDGAVITLVQSLVFGSLLPLMGMANSLIGATFIGAIIIMMFSLSHGIALRSTFDLEYPRFIEYQITLPLSKTWLFAAQTVNFMAELGLTTLPLFSIGILILGDKFARIDSNFLGFGLVYFLTLALFATLFINLSLLYPLRWSFDNLWPRRLSPLFMLSSVSFIWKDVYAFSPKIGWLFLLNPFTYVAEGMRATLIGGERFLPTSICIVALSITVIFNCLLLSYSVKKRLDPL